MSKEISPGDLVVLKSDSPVMVVEEIQGNTCYCTWYNYTTNTLHQRVGIVKYALKLQEE
jgi:uncharacterized protein YodC (DUF2158 family)